MQLNKKKTVLASVIAIATFSSVAMAQMNYGDMDQAAHASVMQQSSATPMSMPVSAKLTKLTESGTDPFATLQEVIEMLEANPNTDWKKVNLEALRLHLLEMQDMTMNVDVVRKQIKNGFEAIVTPTTNRAVMSLTQVLSAHPAQMKAESGWDMQVSNNNGVFTLSVTTDNAGEVDKIRGLGYIGVMAYGNHHQPHHWAIASGNNPHGGQHNMKH